MIKILNGVQKSVELERKIGVAKTIIYLTKTIFFLGLLQCKNIIVKS